MPAAAGSRNKTGALPSRIRRKVDKVSRARFDGNGGVLLREASGTPAAQGRAAMERHGTMPIYTAQRAFMIVMESGCWLRFRLQCRAGSAESRHSDTPLKQPPFR